MPTTSLTIELIDEPRADRRGELLRVLAAAPAEAFDWILVPIVRRQLWPDGRGGFRPASREAIAAIETAVDRYLA